MLPIHSFDFLFDILGDEGVNTALFSIIHLGYEGVDIALFLIIHRRDFSKFFTSRSYKRGVSKKICTTSMGRTSQQIW